MEEYKQKDKKDLKDIACKVIDLFESENISPFDALYVTKQIETAIFESFETFKKDGEENGNKTETIQD